MSDFAPKIIKAVNNRFVARKQEVHDNYETPAWCVESLLNRHHEIRGTILEPCCGPGAIVREVHRLRPKSFVTALELRDGPTIYPGAHRGVDFLTTPFPPLWEHVIVNPPFKQSTLFVRKALEVSTKSVSLFQRAQWLESKGRYQDIWSCLPCKYVWFFVERVGCFQEAEIEKPTVGGMLAFAWFVFVHGYSGSPMLGWIPDLPHFTHDTRIMADGRPTSEYVPLPKKRRSKENAQP
jgi:hypothetical protein